MAGHMIARHLLYKPDLAQWLRSDEGHAKLNSVLQGRILSPSTCLGHLLACILQHLGRHQLWQDLSDEKLVMNALLLTPQSDPRYIGRETVERFARNAGIEAVRTYCFHETSWH